MERLDTYLNHPAHCPHGEPIPRGGDQAPRAELVALSEVPAGRRVILRKVREERALMDYLEAELHLDAEAVVGGGRVRGAGCAVDGGERHAAQP